MTADQQRLRGEALADVVDEEAMRRAKHDPIQEGEDLTPMLLEVLAERRHPALCAEVVGVEPGEQVPAFLLNKTQQPALPRVFWEQLTSSKV